MRHRWITHLVSAVWIVSMLVLARLAAAQVPPPPRPGETREDPPVRVQAFLDVDALRPGDSFRAAVVLTIKKGFHLYAPDDKTEGAVLTRVTAPAVRGISWEAPAYPKSIERTLGGEAYRLYEKRVKVIVKGTAGEALATERGVAELKFEVAYQACTDEICLEPKPKQAVVLEAKVSKPGEPVKPANVEIFAEKNASDAGKNANEKKRS